MALLAPFVHNQEKKLEHTKKVAAKMALIAYATFIFAWTLVHLPITTPNVVLTMVNHVLIQPGLIVAVAATGVWFVWAVILHYFDIETKSPRREQIESTQHSAGLFAIICFLGMAWGELLGTGLPEGQLKHDNNYILILAVIDLSLFLVWILCRTISWCSLPARP